MCNNRKSTSGFTLLELMITLSVAGVLMAMAIPSFSDLMRNNRLTTYTNELITAINLARSESVKRGVQVTILRKSTSNLVWEDGWDVFVDNVQDTGNVAGKIDKGTNAGAVADVVLRTYAPLATGYTLRSGANYSCWLAYTSAGVSRGSGSSCTGGGLDNDTFRVCDKSADKTNARAIVVSPIGRPRTSKGTTVCP